MGFIRGIFEALSVCDWITPTVETWKDFDNYATQVHHKTREVSINKGQLNQARKILGDKLVSSATAPFDSEAILSIRAIGGEDGQESVRDAISLLESQGIDTWGY